MNNIKRALTSTTFWGMVAVIEEMIRAQQYWPAVAGFAIYCAKEAIRHYSEKPAG